MKQVAISQLKKGDKIMVTYEATISKIIENRDGHVDVIGRLNTRLFYEIILFEDTTPNLLVWKKNG